MWRTQAVIQMLLAEVAGLRRGELEEPSSGQALRSAEHRAWRAVAVDWVAIVLLVAMRLGQPPLLPIAATVDTVVTVGLLLVATHSGFRLGQLDKLRAVGRLIDELEERHSAP